ncbi:hypothetical protein B7463_g318, partial [Scytalidium lignicola]
MPPKMHDPKPRLGKEEVEILEREFQRNPKPSTQVKRQYAEEMAVELPRINNWFQNRRAKRKQEKKQEALEASQTQEVGCAYSEPSSPDFFNPQSFFDNNELSPQQSVGSFSNISGPCPQYADLGGVGMDSIHQTLSATQSSSSHDDFQNAYEEQHDGLPSIYGSSTNGLPNGDLTQLANFNGVSEFPYDGAFINNSFDESAHSVQGLHESTATYNDYPVSSVEGVQPVIMTTNFPSQLLPGHLQDLSQNQLSEGSDETPMAVGFTYSTAESDDESLSPPGPSLPFKSPQPTDIASRRKKVHNKPAALGTDTIRSRPLVGPRTVSHADGIRRHTDSPHSSPMRRISSAGGNSRNVISGRVNKSGVESSQRSPINFGGFATTEAFIERNHHGIRYAHGMTAPPAPNSSLAPPTPLSPHGGEMGLVKRANTVSSTSPSDSGLSFTYNPSCYSAGEDQNLASPPETPQAQMILHAATNGWTTGPEINERQWDFEVPDEPIYTPAHETFLELQMPQPMYLSSMSQPVTPAFGQFSPSVLSAHESPQYTQMPGQTDYPFVEPQHYPIMSNPSPSSASRHKTFQFSNCTPADFSDK